MSCIADDPDQAVCTWRDGLEVEAVSPSSQMDDLARLGWDLVHKVNAGLFGQAIVIPLLSDHGILTQVSGKDQDIIKLIPPLVITEQDVGHFLTAFDDVIKKSHRFPGPIWEVASRLTKFAIKKKG